MPVDILEVHVAGLAVEGAVRPADLEQRTDGSPGTSPAVGTRPRDRRQGQTTRAGGVTPLGHPAFVGQPLKIYRRDIERSSLPRLLLSFLNFAIASLVRAKDICMYIRNIYAWIIRKRSFRVGIPDSTIRLCTAI